MPAAPSTWSLRALRRQPLPSPPSVMTAVVDIRRPRILRSLLERLRWASGVAYSKI